MPGPDSSSPDLDGLIEALPGISLKTFLPVWEPTGAATAPGLGRSGPEAFIPAGTEWPSCHGVPMTPVLHLDVASLPEPARSLLGGNGIFQFLCLAGKPRLPDGGWLARVVSADAAGTWTKVPVDAAHPCVAKDRTLVGWREASEVGTEFEWSEGRLEGLLGPGESGRLPGFEVITSLFSQTSTTDRLPPGKVRSTANSMGLDPSKAETVAAMLSHHHGDKLLGWPSWTAEPAWPGSPDEDGCILLLQLSFWHEGGAAHDLPSEVLPYKTHAASEHTGMAHLFVSTDGLRAFKLVWAPKDMEEAQTPEGAGAA